MTSEKTMLDQFFTVGENGVEEAFQTVDEFGKAHDFFVEIPWDEIREKALQSESLSKQASELINETLLEHAEKINTEIAQRVSDINPENFDSYQTILINVLQFYFDNQDIIHFLIDLIKGIKG
ncbi:hypothetical protein EI372_00460 [Vibrio fluvialis]|nr:hypothetical protein [Vibrio fluvialis]MBY7811424.1 hypothetical protein [Vibrio fluvialis]